MTKYGKETKDKNRFRFVQKVKCHERGCVKYNPPEVIIFDDQRFPWCRKHFPQDRKPNIDNFDVKTWKRII